jgi:hypothetical protein
MSKKHKEIARGTLIKMRNSNSIGVIKGILSGKGKYAVYTIEWIVNHGEYQNFQQAFFFEVIG